MRKIAFLILLIGISTAWVSAQSRTQGKGRVTVSGVVVDKEDDSSIMQATVQLLSLPDSTMAVGNVTNNEGTAAVLTLPGLVGYKVVAVEGSATEEEPEDTKKYISFPSITLAIRYLIRFT